MLFLLEHSRSALWIRDNSSEIYATMCDLVTVNIEILMLSNYSGFFKLSVFLIIAFTISTLYM